jgi:superfamily II DNA/RNA helicase
MGFLPDLQRIINLLPKARQNLMFSATFSPEIKKLASSFLNDPVTIEVARSNATAERVTQTVYKVAEDDKRDAVLHLIRGRDLKQILVFSNTKIGASRLARHLEQEGVKASAIHGDKSQAERMTALEAFKNGGVDVLVATDVAARGLDISDLPCVINYDLPYNAEDYVHRIGRTGRAGASGDAISLYTERDSKALADIEKLTRQKFKLDPLPGFVAGRPHHGRREEARMPSSSPSSSSSSAVARPARGPRPQKVDPWFLKPYEPEAESAVKVEARNEKAGLPSKQQPKRAALLGGLTRR